MSISRSCVRSSAHNRHNVAIYVSNFELKQEPCSRSGRARRVRTAAAYPEPVRGARRLDDIDQLLSGAPDSLGRIGRARSASDAGALRRKGRLKEQDRLIDFIIDMHKTHTCEEVMLKLQRWIQARSYAGTSDARPVKWKRQPTEIPVPFPTLNASTAFKCVLMVDTDTLPASLWRADTFSTDICRNRSRCRTMRPLPPLLVRDTMHLLTK
jgi:hypothetical protein